MKRIVLFLILSATTFGQSARQYYNELYKAGGLDNMADMYVCFDDDEKLDTFFIFSQSKIIRQFMSSDGSLAKMPKKFQDEFKKEFLIVRQYDKGVTVGGEDFYDKDGDSWAGGKFVLSKNRNSLGRMRLDVMWETLRYKRAVEITDRSGGFVGQKARYGKCEAVSPAVNQHGFHPSVTSRNP
jgi:hypothetical protein